MESLGNPAWEIGQSLLLSANQSGLSIMLRTMISKWSASSPSSPFTENRKSFRALKTLRGGLFTLSNKK